MRDNSRTAALSQYLLDRLEGEITDSLFLEMKEQKRNEIENCKGKQFDPIIAQIMIEMIDEDINYKMKEK